MISPKPKTINNNLSIMNVLKSFPKQVHSNNVTKYLGTVISLQTWSFSSRQMASRGSLGLTGSSWLELVRFSGRCSSAQ